MESYKLLIKTSARYSAAKTDNTVQVKITGNNGKTTAWSTLDYFFSNDFELGAKEEYTLEHRGDTIGPPMILTFVLRGPNADRNWMCDFVEVTYQGEPYSFPVYKWVQQNEVAVARGEATLPQNENHSLVTELRAQEIVANKKVIQWNPRPTSPDDLGWGINRYLYVNPEKGLPLLFSNTIGQSNRSIESGFELAVNSGLNLFRGPDSLNTLNDYKKLYEGTEFKDPPFINVWQQDKEFGRQVLTGISPTAMKRCTEIPGYCNINESLVSSFLEGKTLQGEMQAGKIYIADYSYAVNIRRNQIPLAGKDFACANAIGLFRVNNAKDFMPIAIQLVPGDKESVFTPADSHYDWLLAKIYLRSVISCMHEWVYHFMLTHGVSETFSVATFRCFPHRHPLYKLLRPHLKSVAAINEAARKTLLPSGALANRAISLSALDTVKYFYKAFNISELDIPKNLTSKGLVDREKLPNYFYRDDAFKIWDVMLQYVTDVVRHFYKNDNDVVNDFELQNWASELANEGLAWQDGNKRGMPDHITSIDELIYICVIVIFSSSAQHAAVNFGQMETYQFIPNATPSMVRPPHKKGEGTLERIMESLPGSAIGTILVSFAYALSMYASDEIFLGQFVEELFVEKEVKLMQRNFKKNLDKLNEEFQQRNKLLEFPYWYLLPSKIPTDINI